MRYRRPVRKSNGLEENGTEIRAVLSYKSYSLIKKRVHFLADFTNLKVCVLCKT